jgi:hypothetical protein
VFRKLVLAFSGLSSIGIAVVLVLTIPLLRRLPYQGHVSMDGVTNTDDAIEACWRTHLQGWELVAYAQHLAARKFTYSRLNIWDTPSRAFERGMGYCEQQALALKKIYAGLGIETRPVFALRCAFPAKIVDGMPSPGGITGHAWLRVRVAGEERDVCPGSVYNAPGVTQFQVLSRVRTWHPWLRPFTHVGSSIENIRRDMVARSNMKRTDQQNLPRSMRESCLTTGRSGRSCQKNDQNICVTKRLSPLASQDGFCQLRVLDQVAHHQGLDGDQPEALDQQGNLLPNEVLSPVANALMDT